MGYKTANAYRSMIGQRLAEMAGTESDVAGAMTPHTAATSPAALRPRIESDVDGAASEHERPMFRDVLVEGTPGAYFRWVPAYNALAYESNRKIHLLDLHTGANWVGPGFIDFIPSPDGAIFVTPSPERHGLEFYDAAEVFAAARLNRGDEVEPFFVDPLMKDQYPSVGILERSGPTTTYRVLTSWFERVAYRDYVIARGREGTMKVRRLRPSEATIPGCPGLQVSLPIMSPDGRELAGRDEGSGTTRIFALSDDGGCTQVVDLGTETGKVAWRGDGRRIAFAIPDQPSAASNSERSGANPELAALYVLQRGEMSIVPVPNSGQLNGLVFPEFVAGDSLAFLIGSASGGRSWFRIACCGR